MHRYKCNIGQEVIAVVTGIDQNKLSHLLESFTVYNLEYKVLMMIFTRL